MKTSKHIFQQRHKHKRYMAYKAASELHNKSIISKYGMPPTAHPPALPEDVIERVIKESYVTKKAWNSV